MARHTQRNTAFVIFGVIIVGSFIFLASESASGEIDIRLPPPAQLTDAGFEPISLPNQQGTFVEATGINCKVKQTTIVVGQRGNLIGEIDRFDSGGIQGSPFVGLAFTFSLQDEEVSHFQIEPKVFCSEANNLPVEVFVNQLQVLTNGRFLGTTQTLDTENIFGSRLLNFGQGQGEQRIEQFIITATDLESGLPQQNFPATYDFHVIGTLNVQYRDFPQIVYQIPILFGELQTSYIVNIIKDPFVVPPPEVSDIDGDGILDSVDQCPFEPETKNGFEDGDGCPDTAPPIPITPPEPTELTCQATGDAKLCMIECVNAGKEWKILNGEEVCVDAGTLPTDGDGIIPTPTPTPTSTQELFESGFLQSLTTIRYLDGSGVEILGDFSGEQISVITGGVFPTASLIGQTLGGDEKALQEIEYNIFYLFPDSVSDAIIQNNVELIESDIFFELEVIESSVSRAEFSGIPPERATIGEAVLIGTDTRAIGFGFGLGETTISDAFIEQIAIEAGVTEGQARDIKIRITVEGEFILGSGTERQTFVFPIDDTFIELTGFTFDNAVTPVAGGAESCPPNTVPVLDNKGELLRCVPLEIDTETCRTPERPQGFNCDDSYIELFCTNGNTNLCVEPDRDNDGFVDILDNCPNTSASANEGCPVGQVVDHPQCMTIIDGICVLGTQIIQEQSDSIFGVTPDGELDLNSLLVIGGIGLIIIAVIVVIVRRR